MNQPFFSVIIPAYNRAYIIKKTIQSVLNQSFTNFEVIIVDDGSTDKTNEVVASISDARLKYVYQTNAERSAARNNGIRHAKGAFICFLDSDDWYEPQHLAILHAEIQKTENQVALFFTHNYTFQNNKQSKPEIPLLTKSAFEYLLQYPVIPARVCIHSSILLHHQFREDIVIVEDQVLWVNIAYYFPVYQISEYTVVYHLHDDNSINIKNNCYKHRLNGMKKLFDQTDIRKVISAKTKRAIISNCYYGIAKHYAYKKHYTKMFVNICMSIFINPFHVHTKAKLYMLLKPQQIF